MYAAASISRCSVWAAGWQAMKFASAGFLVPFFFVFYPALLFQGEWLDIGRAVLSGSIGVVALAAGLEGYFVRNATWLERGLFLAAALLLIDPGLVTDLIGLGLLAKEPDLPVAGLRPEATSARAAGAAGSAPR